MKILQPNEIESLSKEEISELYRKLYSLYIKTRNSMAKSALEAAKEQVRVETLEQQRRELREIASFLRGETDFRDISLGAKLTMRYLISVKHEWSVIRKEKEAVQMVLNFINAKMLLEGHYEEDLNDIRLFLETGGRRGKSWRIRWQPWEDEILMDDKLTGIQKAYMTGRSYSSVVRRMYVLKRKDNK